MTTIYRYAAQYDAADLPVDALRGDAAEYRAPADWIALPEGDVGDSVTVTLWKGSGSRVYTIQADAVRGWEVPEQISGVVACTSDGFVIGTGPLAFTTQSGSGGIGDDRIRAQLISDEITLGNTDEDLFIATGQRFLLEGSTYTRARFKRLRNAGAVRNDRAQFRVEPGTATLAYNSVVIRDEAGEEILNCPLSERKLYYAQFNGTKWVGETPTGLAVFNVKDYGAVGDEEYGVFNGQKESQAIQRAIDAAAACCRATYHKGAVVFFPAGVYRIDGHPLILRRTLYNSPLTYMGAGYRSVSIVNATGIGENGDALRAETPTENPNILHGGEGHHFQDIDVIAKHYALIWDAGDEVEPGTHDGMRFGPKVTRCHFSRPGTPGPAVRIRTCSRAKFLECTFDPGNVVPGCIGLEVVRGSFSMYACKGGGSLVRARDGGEVSLIGCRCEGSQAVPAWNFYNIAGLHIANATNEGNDEADACFLFEECRQVTCDNLSPAVTRSYIVLTALKQITGTPTLTFSHTPAVGDLSSSIYTVAENKIVRDEGSWFEDYIGYGGKLRVPGATGANGELLTIREVTHKEIWVKETLTPEVVPNATGTATFAIGLFNPNALPGIWFDAATQTIHREDGSWEDDGFLFGQQVYTSSVTNPGPFVIAAGGVGTTTLEVESGLVNEGTALAPVKRKVNADLTAAGTCFRGCWNFHCRNQWQGQGGFSSIGGGTRYGIEVDADCRDGWVENAHTGHQSDIFIHPDAQDCLGVSHGNSTNPAWRKTWVHGKQQYENLDILKELVRVNVERLTTPTAGKIHGTSIRRGPLAGFDAVGSYYVESAFAGHQNGFFDGYSEDEETLTGILLDRHSKRFIGPLDDTAIMVARSGRAWGVAFSSGPEPEKLGDTFKITIVGNDFILNGCTRIFRGAPLAVEVVGALTIHPTVSCDIYAGGKHCFTGAASGSIVANLRPLVSPQIGTGLNTLQDGRVVRSSIVRTITHEALTELDASQTINFEALLPAKTKIVACYADTIIPFQGGGALGVSAEVGTTDDPDALILAHDILTGAVTKGLVDADLGEGLARATAVQGGHVPSWTVAKAVRVKFDITAGEGVTVADLTQGFMVVVLQVEYLGWP